MSDRPAEGTPICFERDPSALAGYDYYGHYCGGKPTDKSVFLGDAMQLLCFAVHPGDADHGWGVEGWYERCYGDEACLALCPLCGKGPAMRIVYGAFELRAV